MESENSVGLSINVLGVKLEITRSVLVQWAIIVVLTLICFLLTRNLKRKPDKKQTILEIFYELIENLVLENMGKDYLSFIPFVGTLVLYLMIMNVVPLVAVPAPTEDLSVTIGMALVSFLVIQGYSIYKNGLKGYFLGLLHPVAVMLPMNIIERIMLVVSLSLRLFGNIAAGAVIMGIAYSSLRDASPLLNIGIPVPFHFYFDIFDGFIQMLIFVMLTMIHIKIVAED
ncbi:MAG: F0F1 ATP synthase subunit A [Clostridiales bacterium]|nr:F0F1 ATP synthase subunit A [Clostridiales bacterium]